VLTLNHIATKYAPAWAPVAIMLALSGWMTERFSDEIDEALRSSRDVPYLRRDLTKLDQRVEKLEAMDRKIDKLLGLAAAK
jgi:hypothetical protein